MLWQHLTLFLILLLNQAAQGSLVDIKNNGYAGLLVALPHYLPKEERAWVVLHVENTLRSASEILQRSTKGRAYFAEVSFIVPESWNLPDPDPLWESTSFNASWFLEAKATQGVTEADVTVSEAGLNPYVLHQGGCGQRAKRIVLPKSFLFESEFRGQEFARLWSEYRYGVFPEGGFKNDEMYPQTYTTPGEKGENITGCADQKFRIANCNEEDKYCSDSLTSSIMDQNLSPSRKGKLFCEGHIGLGPRHDPLSPSKHNLICKEESTWFTVMRNPDFVRGRNAAPRRRQEALAVSFHFIRERTSPKVMVAVETSSRMARENRLLLTRSPLNRFLVSALPHGSEVTLFFFGGDEGIKIEKHAIELIDEESKEHFIESLSFPDEVSETEDVSMAELFDVIFQTMRNRSVTTSADIIIVTTEPHVEGTAFAGIKQKISESDSRLHVMLFDEFDMDKPKGALLYDLCQETGGRFTSLHVDIFGNMHKSFADVFKRPNQEILIMQEYLTEDDDVGIQVSFVLDESLTHNLKVYLSFHAAGTESLQYMRTSVQMPSGRGYLNFLKMNVLDAWVVYLNKPEAGEYILRTRRKDGYLYPVLMTVTGTPSLNRDPITVNLWAETVASSGVFPAPLKIFCEVRKGWSPVANAQITVTVHHPYGETSNLTLSDDGLGDADITKNDGIYGGYFTKFTAPGYYNVHVIVTGEQNTTDALIGPDGPCCGSFFPAAGAHPTNRFRREAGPFTFYVPPYEVPSDADKYPPSRVTDLRITDRIDRLCILQWTAVGDDYDAGFAATYEIKIFRDSAIIQSRFADSGQEVYSEVIDTTPEATYGTPLNHVFQLPTDIKRGLYYVALRAFDSWGNAGEPSNAVPLLVEESELETIDCESNNERDCENEECEALPLAEKLLDNNSSKKLMPFNAFLRIMSLILFLV